MATFLPRTLISLGLLLLAHAYAPLPFPSTPANLPPPQLLLRLRTRLHLPLPLPLTNLPTLSFYSLDINSPPPRHRPRNHPLRRNDLHRPRGGHGRAAADSVARVGWEGGARGEEGGEGESMGELGGEGRVCGY